ncbi:MAG: hypothetical protein E3J70_05110 [Candidatus Heimdallarchaeota archaeon]|nr:MAG: hypothetical protein E3J70_05110 [Candidatus Heimdallarchaeota archaeon]
MASEAQWLFITDKYSLVEYLDNAIVVARFNQNELMRELIEIRCKMLEAKSYDDVLAILDSLLKLNEKVIDDRLGEVLGGLIEQISFYKDSRIDYKGKADKAKS